MSWLTTAFDFISFQYPASVTLDDIKRDDPTFGDKICPFAKLAEEKKGVAAKCPAFKGGCPFKECKNVGDFQDLLGQMRDKTKEQSKGDAAHVEFLRVVVQTAKDKEVAVGATCTFFQTKGGCPFAKDTSGKPILSPDYIVVCF